MGKEGNEWVTTCGKIANKRCFEWKNEWKIDNPMHFSQRTQLRLPVYRIQHIHEEGLNVGSSFCFSLASLNIYKDGNII